mmetsp:Transcript_29006/g.84265  ORF Transcript_29006/g.84265 Transcript_29006/m.84265 type:complete len:264 (+) Transcript_29006:193-984(+)
MSSLEDNCLRVCRGHATFSLVSCPEVHVGKRGLVMRRLLPVNVIFSDLVKMQITILLRKVLPSEAMIEAASPNVSKGRISTNDCSTPVGLSGASDMSHWMRGSHQPPSPVQCSLHRWILTQLLPDSMLSRRIAAAREASAVFAFSSADLAALFISAVSANAISLYTSRSLLDKTAHISHISRRISCSDAIGTSAAVTICPSFVLSRLSRCFVHRINKRLFASSLIEWLDEYTLNGGLGFALVLRDALSTLDLNNFASFSRLWR